MSTVDQSYDAIVIGSGFGGSGVAHELVRAGMRVLMLERGDWVTRAKSNWDEVYGFFQLTAAYTMETSYLVEHAGKSEEQGICACVGGPSVYYGAASFRFRESDFERNPEIVDGTGAEWPFSYSELEPYYSRAESLLSVAGAFDQMDPPRSIPYPQSSPELSGTSLRIAAAAERLGLHPSRIPLAIEYRHDSVARCVACTTCDAFACAIGAKQDLATAILPGLVARGLEIRANFVVTRLVEENGRITEVQGVDRGTGERLAFRATVVVLSAGALASPHLLLASGLHLRNPGGDTIGRYLMRHCNAFVYGLFLPPPNPDRAHHKQVAIFDFYQGGNAPDAPTGKLGSLQQVMAPPAGAPMRGLPKLGPLAGSAAFVGLRVLRPPLDSLTGLLAIAEDQPQYSNRVELDEKREDRFGLPGARVVHEYSERDERARTALVNRAREILRVAGARFTLRKNITTFSHAVGTVRMGNDPTSSALDEYCQFRGVENLYVVDGSFMPTSAGVNPSLTIAANALRVGRKLVQNAA